jgi:serine phosphatase RsbU (regulator of sigma subunit)
MSEQHPLEALPASEPIFLTPVPENGTAPCRTNHHQAYQELLDSARNLIERVQTREAEMRKVLKFTESINRGLELEEVLDCVWRELHGLVPFNRIGFALIDPREDWVVSRWVRSDRPIFLGVNYKAPLAGSTLERILRGGCPRIINDLPGYLAGKRQSRSTELIVREGMRSSLTCPLVVRGRPVGFLFFSSEKDNTYSNVHVAFFQQVAGQLSVIVEKSRLYTELAEQAAVIERQNRQLTKELEMARRLQRALIPQQPPQLPDLAVAFLYEPAQQVGGDLLDILPLARLRAGTPEGGALLFVGDAMGHGVEAALLMAAARTALHTAVQGTADPALVLRHINRELCDLIGDRFVTAVCARVDPAAGRLDLALAGHVEPLLFDARNEMVGRPHACPNTGAQAGLPLGVRAEEEYACVRCRFGPGDTLVLATDGVLEAGAPHGQPYGEERLAAQIGLHSRAGAAALLQAIEHDLKSHCRKANPKDDLTLLVAKSTARAPVDSAGPPPL